MRVNEFGDREPAEAGAASTGRNGALAATLARRECQLNVLARVAERVHRAEEKEILQGAIDEILVGLGLAAAWVFVGSEGDDTLKLAASRGLDEAYRAGLVNQGAGSCLCPDVFRSGHRMLARNTIDCPRMPNIVAGLAQPVAHACVPLHFEGRRYGVLNVAAPPGKIFDDGDLQFLETVGNQACLAVEKAQHIEAERSLDRQARALAEVTKALGGSLNLPHVLRSIGDTARSLLHAEHAAVLLGPDARRLKIAHVSGSPQDDLSPGKTLDLVATGSRLLRRAFDKGQLQVMSDIDDHPFASRELAMRWSARSGVAVPLVSHGRVHGLLVVWRALPHEWTQAEVDFADALASQASVALESARLYEEARRAYDDLRAAQARTIDAERMATVGTFAAGLAHEIRNPLNSIGLQIARLERRSNLLASDVAEHFAELLRLIREEVQRLDDLVSDFLLFSKTSHAEPAPGDLASLIDGVVDLLGPEAEASGVRLQRDNRGPLPLLPMDAPRMKQVVINLVRNAIEAMPEGGTVVVESGLVDDGPRFAVRDEGPGLPEGIDVFQLFVTTKPKGTGLGLAIAQQIVAEHGGNIEARSLPERGSQFTVTLPAPTGDLSEEKKR